MTTLHNFLDGTVAGDGYRPVSGLIQGIDGSLYGTTYDGGANGVGTVFKLTPPSGVGTTWTESILYSFGSSANDGTNPQAPLVFGPDGSLYDTTPMGGISNRGTVFKLTSSSGVWTETILHIFDVPNGTVPQAGLVRGADGNFYGTASTGGASQGTIFAVTPAGVFTLLHTFGVFPDGWFSVASMCLGTDGNLYGTTAEGPSLGTNGTVFKLILPISADTPAMPLWILVGLGLLLFLVAVFMLPKRQPSVM